MYPKCNVNGIMYYTSTCTWDILSQCYINNVYAVKWSLMFCRHGGRGVFDNKKPVCCVLYTAFNGTSADPGGILCAGLVVSSWIAYEIFERPERCMMNEVACYLYAYRAHWLATGSAKGSGSKWNSAQGQYIIKRNVCTPKLTRLLQMRTRCLTGGWGGRVRSMQEEGAADFVESVLFSYWLISVF